MARRRRRKASNPLSKWGYPSSKALRKEAGQIANASVPTVKSTTRPYTSQQKSVSGWLDAVLGALNDSSGQAQAAYSTANTQQQAIDAAAQARLAGLGLGSYSAGVQAAQGAQGDSASANLIARGAASGEYSARQPGVATGYANVQHNTISKALEDALSQRMDERRMAYGQAIQTVQANALNRANFLAGRQDAATQRSQFGQQMAFNRTGQQIQVDQFNSSQAEQQREFDLGRQDQWNQFNISRSDNLKQFRAQSIAQYGYDPVTNKFVKGGAGAQGLGSFTTSERASAVQDAQDTFNNNLPDYATLRREMGDKYGTQVGNQLALATFAHAARPPAFNQVNPHNHINLYKYGEQDPAYIKDMIAYNKAKGDHDKLIARYNLIMNAFNQTIMNQQQRKRTSAYKKATSSGPNKGEPWLNKAG